MEFTDRNALKDIGNLLKYIASFDRIFIFSDFDGTLARFRKNPRNVKLSRKASCTLEKILKNLKIITGIVSGRKISELEFFLGSHLSENFNLFGCHGSEIKFKNKNIKIAAEVMESMEIIRLIQENIEKNFKNESSFIFEKKESSFAVNYRNTGYMKKNKIDEMKNSFLEFEKIFPVKFLDLKKVFEIVPSNINKSTAIKETIKEYGSILEECSYIFLCLGDDTTDENLFIENKNGVNIKVGIDNLDTTHAQYFLSSIKEVFSFLSKIACI